MPRGSTSSTTKRSSNNAQNNNGNGSNNHQQNGGLVLPKRHQPGRSRSSSNANNVASGNSAAVPSTSNGSPHQQQQSQTQPQDVPNLTKSTLLESSQAKVGAGAGVGMSSPNSSGDLSGVTVTRIHFDGEGNIGNGSIGMQKRMIDLDQSGATGSDGQFKTILPSWPLVDSLMLLIILLQLPTAVLSVVHFIFALVALIPPNFTLFGNNAFAPAISFSSVVSYMFQAQQGGPSIVTIIMSDCLIGLISIILWPSGRLFLMDLAQAVVALSLGAGTSGSGNSGAMRNAAVCASIVGISQISREWSRIARHLGISLWQGSDNMLPSAPSTSSPSTVRSALAVHIVAQGITKATRRWLTLRDPSEYANSSTSNSASASASTLSPASANHGTGSTAKGGSASSVSSLPKDPEAGCPNTKKKGKQGVWIRNQQPLWAALASSLVHMKEVDKLRTASSSDSKPPLSDTTTSTDESTVWITRIGATEIEFGSNYHPAAGSPEDDDVSNKRSPFPFIVELNGIKWPQTTISKSSGNGGGDDSTLSGSRNEDEWTAEITGLNPTTEYDISFIRKNTGEVIYSTSVGTTSKQANIDAPGEIVKPQPKPSRPLSPITTLQNSLNSSRNNLEEQKKRLKLTKKANSRKIGTLRSEIDSLRSRLGSGDKVDERARRRALSLRDSVRRAEEETETIQTELHTLLELPEEYEKEWDGKKKLWKTDRESLESSEKDIRAKREQADRRIVEVKNEVTSANSKREKAAKKVSNLRTDLDRIRTESVATAGEREKAKQYDAVVRRRQTIEMDFSSAITKMEHGMINFRQRARENYTNIQALESTYILQQQQNVQAHQMSMGMTASDMNYPLGATMNSNVSPRSVFGQQTSPLFNPYASIYNQTSPTHAASFSNISSVQQHQNPIVSPFASGYAGYDARGRSASMFSTDSAITNLSDYDLLRKKSIAEGASSGSSSGSDSLDMGGYGNHGFMPSFPQDSNTDQSSAGVFGRSHVGPLKSGLSFAPLPAPTPVVPSGSTVTVKPKAIA